MGDDSELLRTIKIQKNLFKLQLPTPTYEQLSFATIPNNQSKQYSLMQQNDE